MEVGAPPEVVGMAEAEYMVILSFEAVEEEGYRCC